MPCYNAHALSTPMLRNDVEYGVQMNVEYSSPLIMHMLVLHGNIGSKLDISFNGYIVENMKTKFPESKYIAPIEEHNIHAIFKWESILDIVRKEKSLLVNTSDDGAVNFLNCTELTVSITRLGTCIYRVGSKIKSDSETEQSDQNRKNITYSDETEDFIIEKCCFIANFNSIDYKKDYVFKSDNSKLCFFNNL